MDSLEPMLLALEGRRVAVVGGGVSGVAAGRLLLRRGAKVLISDAASRAQARPDLLALEAEGAELELGGHTEKLFGQELLILSPGVNPELPILIEAKQRGIPRASETELGFRLAARDVRIAAITGTNGKTTTTALLGHMAGDEAFVGGNIGRPLCLLEAQKTVVLELSSFQIEGLDAFRAEVAVHLNLTPDHLDRYGTIESYARAKERLFERLTPTGVAVLNADNPYCTRIGDRLTRAHLAWFSTQRALGEGAWLEQPDIGVLVWRGQRARFRLGDGTLRGLHNRENQLAAICAATALGIPPERIQSSLVSFPGVEHRMEKVPSPASVGWYNDSKATNDDAAAKALLSFDQPVVWLAGGRDKGGGYELCRAAARGRVKVALLFGEAAPLLERALAGVCAAERVTDLDAAVERARTVAVAGDTVLLSPACSSYDQFKNFEERGKRFKTLVQGAAGA